MISRYARKPVSHTLEIRGLSRNGVQHHPLPEKPDEILPATLLTDETEEAVSTYSSESEVLGDSSCLTDTPGNIGNSWSAIQSYTGTGISTERSSVFSWGYDEFDRAASQQVHRMFGAIDEFLYEGKRGTEQRSLQEECEQWASRFPHLRILGKQIVMPIDEGYAWYPSRTCEMSDSSSSSLGRDQGFSELRIFGKKALLSSSPSYRDSVSPKPIPLYVGERKEEEEDSGVIVSEGVVEEYLAFDCRDLDDELCEKKKGVQTHRQKLGFPPVSPCCCMKDAVLIEAFDDVWREMVGCMQELIWHHWEGFIPDNQRNTVTLETTRANYGSSFLPFEPPQVVIPRVPQTKVPTVTSNLIHSQVNRTQAETSSPQRNLTGLMVIQGIPLQQRNLAIADTVQNSEERPIVRPGSSAIHLNRSRSNRPLEHSTSSLSRSAQSARRRNPPRTLYPLNPNHSRSGTPGSMDEVIRGTRLTTASDRLSSPPTPLSRNYLLPPIGSADSEHSSTVPTYRQQQKSRVNSSRAQSAVSEETSHQPLQERFLVPEIYSRPNTTHTFRSDTPFRRSLTVLDYANQSRTGRGSAGPDSISIGVTGISLGITTSSYVDSFHHHLLGHSPIEDEEEDEDHHPLGHQLLVPVRSASRGGIFTRSRQGL